jgi:RNA polymerase sigma-70 factor (ECF subfamily)
LIFIATFFAMSPRLDMDASNWSQLVTELSPALYRYFSACLDRSSAEDCVQETLFRLFQKLGDGHYDSSRGNLRMYAYGIARYVKLEARKAQPHLETLEYELESIPDDGADPQQSLEHKRRIQALRVAMNQLNDIQQEVLQLYIDQELTLEEIGVLLNLPSGTVKSHIYRAKEKLKELLSSQMEMIK